jgi:hypothetical protein
LAGRAGFEPAHGVSNSHVPFQLGYRPKSEGPDVWSGPSRIESELGNLTNGQTNPEGTARLTRRLIMDLVFIVIFEIEYKTLSARWSHSYASFAEAGSQGIPAEPSKSEIPAQWFHSLAALAAKPFLTTSLQAHEKSERRTFLP